MAEPPIVPQRGVQRGQRHLGPGAGRLVFHTLIYSSLRYLPLYFTLLFCLSYDSSLPPLCTVSPLTCELLHTFLFFWEGCLFHSLNFMPLLYLSYVCTPQPTHRYTYLSVITRTCNNVQQALLSDVWDNVLFFGIFASGNCTVTHKSAIYSFFRHTFTQVLFLEWYSVHFSLRPFMNELCGLGLA